MLILPHPVSTPVPVDVASQTRQARFLPFSTRWRRRLYFLALQILGWSAFSLLGTLSWLNEDLRTHTPFDFWNAYQKWGRISIALALLSMLLYYCFSRWPKALSNAKHIAVGYGLMLLLLFPLQMMNIAKFYFESQQLSWNGIWQQVMALDSISCLLRFSTISAVYFGVVAIKIWQQNQAQMRYLAQSEAAAAKAQADSLALRLALEHQRLLALRAQLEPHFVFNALNAISALVRSDKKDIALDGIQGLSDLLRYALKASEDTSDPTNSNSAQKSGHQPDNWVKLSDELNFLDDYLALQRLRFGARLHIVITGASPEILNLSCPPLLLQPLIENAIRHDLEAHEGVSDITVQFRRDDEQLHIFIQNQVHTQGPKNHGLGLGLRNIAARLQLMYGAAASIQTSAQDQFFLVHLRLPWAVEVS